MRRLLHFLNPLHLSGLAIWVGVAVIVLAGGFLFASRSSREDITLTLSTGRFVEPPKRITKLLLDRASANGLRFKQVDVEGSEDTLDRIHRGEVKMGIVKGGMALDDRINVRQVTALDIETFHLLVRPELYDAVMKDFGALRGKRINVNKPATGTHYWVLDILRFAGLRAPDEKDKGNYTPLDLGNPEMLKELDRIEAADEKLKESLIAGLPDAVLLAEPIPSPLANRFVRAAGYRLAPLAFGSAYIQHRHGAEPDKHLDAAVMIELVSIPAFSYGVSPAAPPEPCPSIGLRRLLVANKDVPDEAIVRCLRLLYDHPAPPALELLDWAKVRPEYELHDGVQVYDNERKHVLQNTVVKLLERLASVLGGIVGAILAIYGYIRYRRLLRFEHYFHEIRTIDLIGRGKLPDPAAPTERAQLLAYLQNKLAELRSAAIAEFAQGRLQGENLILSIFTLIQDTNSSLASLLEAQRRIDP